jgi:hypothetical protein
MVEVPGNTCNKYEDIFIICTFRTIKKWGIHNFHYDKSCCETKSFQFFLATEEKIIVAKMVEVPGNTCNEYYDIFIICTSRTIKNGGFTTFIMTNPGVETKSLQFF